MPGEEDGHLYAGGDPGVLFESRDGGMTWELNKGFWEQPTRPEWGPGAGGMCLHSIATWPGDPSRLAWGSPRSASGSRTTAARPGGTGTRASSRATCRRRPARTRSPSASTTCTAHPTQPDRLFMQFHGGVYRSDDAGESWIDIGTDTGCRPTSASRSSIDPDDADSAYVIPLVADLDRVTPEGRVRVYETRDAGASWSPRGDGLPAEDAYLTDPAPGVRRDGSGEGMGLYFGATSGDVFGSAGRRRELVHGGDEAPAGVFRTRGVPETAGVRL